MSWSERKRRNFENPWSSFSSPQKILALDRDPLGTDSNLATLHLRHWQQAHSDHCALLPFLEHNSWRVGHMLRHFSRLLYWKEIHWANLADWSLISVGWSTLLAFFLSWALHYLLLFSLRVTKWCTQLPFTSWWTQTGTWWPSSATSWQSCCP